jgi:hypothetical protein
MQTLEINDHRNLGADITEKFRVPFKRALFIMHYFITDKILI